MEVDKSPLWLNVTHLQIACFFEPQPHEIDGSKVNGDPLGGAGIDDLVYLIDAGKGDADGTVSELFFILQIQKVLSQLGFGSLVGPSLGVVGQLPDCSQVSVDCSLAHAGQLEVITYLLVQLVIKEL